MKTRFIILCATALMLCGCERSFNELLSKSRSAFADKNYTVVIDNLTLAIPRWKTNDGADQKGEAYELLGKSYHALRKLDQAADAFKMAVKLSNQRYDSAYTLGILYLAQSDPRDAQQAFQDALRMRTDDPLALVGLGDALYAQRKFAQAEEIYRRVLAVSPGVLDALNNLELVSKAKKNPRSVLPAKKSSRKR